MSLTTEQKQQVAQWVGQGATLSEVQARLNSEFSISMTYMDVRFLVDDLDLELKDPKPATPPKESKAAAAAPAEELPAKDEEDAYAEETEEDAIPPTPGEARVSVSLDKVTLIPGAMASGTVTFSDGVTGKWIVDQYGRPGFTEVSQPGYRPSPEDAQAFMRELSLAIQGQGY